MGRPQSKPTGEPLPTPPEWSWTVAEIAFAHRMKDDAVLAAIKRGDLRALNLPAGYRVPHSWYREWLDGSTVKPVKEVA